MQQTELHMRDSKLKLSTSPTSLSGGGHKHLSPVSLLCPQEGDSGLASSTKGPSSLLSPLDESLSSQFKTIENFTLLTKTTFSAKCPSTHYRDGGHCGWGECLDFQKLPQAELLQLFIHLVPEL